MAGSENKRWPVLETYVNAPARQLLFQVWDGYGDKFNGIGFTLYLNAKLGGTQVITDLLMEEVEEESGLYRAIYEFTNAGDHDAQIKVVNALAAEDFCEPVTIRVKERI